MWMVKILWSKISLLQSLICKYFSFALDPLYWNLNERGGKSFIPRQKAIMWIRAWFSFPWDNLRGLILKPHQRATNSRSRKEGSRRRRKNWRGVLLYTLDTWKLCQNTHRLFLMKTCSVTESIRETTDLHNLSSIYQKFTLLNVSQTTKQTGINTFLNMNISDSVDEQSHIQLSINELIKNIRWYHFSEMEVV